MVKLIQDSHSAKISARKQNYDAGVGDVGVVLHLEA